MRKDLEDITQYAKAKVTAPKKKKAKRNKKGEETVQVKVVSFLNNFYPDIDFTCGAEGVRLPVGIAVKLNLLGIIRKGNPDVTIFHPTKHYHGLFIELKDENVTVYKKDGTLKKSEHIATQNKVLERLRKKGYYTCFASGFEQAKQIIQDYIQEKL